MFNAPKRLRLSVKDINNMDSDTLILLLMTMWMIWEGHRRYRKYNHRFWVKPLHWNRDVSELFNTTFDNLYFNDCEQFKLNIGMDAQVFDLLLNLTEKKTKSSFRQLISAKCRLYLTLQYLANGDSVRYLSVYFKMRASIVRTIIQETCVVIWNMLAPLYVSLPNKSEWKRIAGDFENICDLPHCLGAIDGKHIEVVCPPNINSQDKLTIVLLGVCDANYMFTAVDIGAYASQSDGSIMCHLDFGKRLIRNELNLPTTNFLPNSKIKFPYYFVGDAAFPLRNNIMRPYPGTLLPKDREIFNKRLSRAKRIIENTFGVLVSRWRVLLSPIHMNVDNAASMVKAIVALHNFVKVHDEAYCPPEYVDFENDGECKKGLWRQSAAPLRNIRRFSSNNATRNAFQLRDILKDYLCKKPI